MLLEMVEAEVLWLLEQMEQVDQDLLEEMVEMVEMAEECLLLLVVMVFLVVHLDIMLAVAVVAHKKVQYQQKTQELEEKGVEEQVKKEHLVLPLQVELIILVVELEDLVQLMLVIQVEMAVQE